MVKHIPNEFMYWPQAKKRTYLKHMQSTGSPAQKAAATRLLKHIAAIGEVSKARKERRY